MKRSAFLLLSGLIALAIGTFALFAPAVLLASKGVASAAANIWAQEVGALLIAVGILAVMVRQHRDSPTLKAVLVSIVVMQIGLFAIEALAYRNGIITLLSGIVPNLMIHVFLAAGLIYYIVTMRNANLDSPY